MTRLTPYRKIDGNILADLLMTDTPGLELGQPIPYPNYKDEANPVDLIVAAWLKRLPINWVEVKEVSRFRIPDLVQERLHPDYVNYGREPLYIIIFTLWKYDGWSREKIADWLRAL